MSLGSKRFGRRLFLRGAAAGTAIEVGLPTLSVMLNDAGSAFADGTVIPRRFGMFFWGNGVGEKTWNPTGIGRGYTPSAPLKPFADAGVIDQLSVVTHTSAPTKGFWAHHTAYKTMMAAATPIYEKPNFEGFPGKYGGPRFDEVIADAIGGATRTRRIKVQVSRSPGNVSHLNGDVKTSRYNPQAMFDELFGAGVMATGVSPATWVTGMRRSVLDVVRADAEELRGRLPATDRQRLDQHLDGVRAVEKNLMATGGAKATGCDAPARSPSRPPDSGRQEPLTPVSRAFSDLIAYALACDISRTFDLTFTGLQTDTVLWEAGLTGGHHDVGHNEAGEQPQIQKATVFMMEQFAYLLARLKERKVGAGTLLDHCCVYGTSEQNTPRGHGTWNVPLLIAGRAGGALRGGVHYQAVPTSSQKNDPAANHTRVLLTMMRAVGLPLKTFGLELNQASTSITELEA